MNWARCLSLAALIACAPQSDLVALREAAASCGNCDAAGTGAGTCTASETCMECSAADSCNDDASARCLDRACVPASTRTDICLRTGPVFALGDGCGDALSNPRFRYALCSRADLATLAPLTVLGDVALDSPMVAASFGAPVTVEGTLHYVGELPPAPSGSSIVPVRGTAQCGQAQTALLDIAQVVKDRALDNDNATLTGSPLAGLENVTGTREITLPCGRYYLGPIQGEGQLIIHTRGQVAIFVDGAVGLGGGLTIESSTASRVTVVVNGALRVTGGFSMGTLSALRNLLVVAGQIYFDGGQAELGGVIYAPDNELLSTSTLSLYGSAFVRSARFNGSTTLTYSAAAALAAYSCDVASP